MELEVRKKGFRGLLSKPTIHPQGEPVPFSYHSRFGDGTVIDGNGQAIITKDNEIELHTLVSFLAPGKTEPTYEELIEEVSGEIFNALKLSHQGETIRCRSSM